jgi:aspartyl-tRNA(Asn)/glutamyl-tRNA(Gln) amidotransferase subunit A
VTEWTAAGVAEALRRDVVSCAEVTEELLARARHADAELACFIAVDEDAARERARLLDDDPSACFGGPLRGVPYGHKDVFVSESRLPTAGARDLPLEMRGRQSPVRERIDAAGAVPFGPLNLDQFGYAATGINPDFGDVRNPWDTARIAGGSSSGAAAAVAATALPFAIGADTGGSVRIPASYCGVVGLKPTLGRIPRRGTVPISYSQDTVGVLARTVSDVALVLDVTAGHDPLDPASFDVPAPPIAPTLATAAQRMDGLRLGVDDAYLEAMLSADVHEGVQRAVGVLEGLGATVVPVDLSGLARCDAAATVLTWAEIGSVHSPTFARRRPDYASAIRSRLDAALLSHGADHVDALRFQGRALADFIDRVLARADIVVTASTGGSPATVEAVTGGDTEAVAVSVASLRLNRPFNFLGLPALSVPMGFTADGLPMGLQLVGRPWSEARVLACAAAYEGATDWHRRQPPIAGDPPHTRRRTAP